MRTTEPSERNFAIFCAVEFEGTSLRAAAKEYEISPTRVQQIVDQTRVWYVESTPGWVRETDPSTQPLLACRMHQGRLQHLYREAMRSWRESKTELTTKRLSPGMSELHVTQRSFGDPRYLTVALKFSRAEIDAAVRLAEIYEKQTAKAAPAPVETEPELTTPCAPCALEAAPAPKVVEVDEDVVTLSLELQPISSEPEALPLASCAARENAPTPVRSRKERRKLERHRRRAALRKQTSLAG